MTNSTTIALVRAMLARDADGLCPAVVRKDGHARSGARLEVVVKDPSGSFTWSEVHLGLATKSGKLDFSSFPRRTVEIGGLTRRAGKRQIIRTGDSLLPWQEANLRYAQGRLERQAHSEAVAFDVPTFVKAEERTITRRTAKGFVEMNWAPELLRGQDRLDMTESLELDPKISDAGLIAAVGGDPDAGIIPACLLKEVIPEAVLLDMRQYTGWVAVNASTIPGLLSLAEFSAREADIAQKRDLRLNGLRNQPPKKDYVPEVQTEEVGTDAPSPAVTSVTEPVQG